MKEAKKIRVTGIPSKRQMNSLWNSLLLVGDGFREAFLGPVEKGICFHKVAESPAEDDDDVISCPALVSLRTSAISKLEGAQQFTAAGTFCVLGTCAAFILGFVIMIVETLDASPVFCGAVLVLD